MKTLGMLVGILAVVLYILSYQFQKRKTIVAVYSLANILYVTQYILLGAYTGAVMDFFAFLSGMIARKSSHRLVQKYRYFIIAVLDICMISAGLLLYKNAFSLFAIVAVIVETTALWCKEENNIRKLTLIASPLWLTYNIAFAAFGSAIGNVLNLVSLTTAILRYKVKKSDRFS